jgi:hypothetical protein
MRCLFQPCGFGVSLDEVARACPVTQILVVQARRYRMRCGQRKNTTRDTRCNTPAQIILRPLRVLVKDNGTSTSIHKGLQVARQFRATA